MPSPQIQALAAILEHLIDGVCLTDKGGRLVYANVAARRLLDMTGTETRGKTLYDLFCRHLLSQGPGAPSPASCPMRTAGSRLEAVTFRGSLPLGKDSRSAVCHARGGAELRLRCMRLPGGGSDGGRMLHIEDITPEVELEKRQEEWREMLAHDVRSPLTNILGALRLAEELPPGTNFGEADRELVRFGIRACHKIRDLVDDYLQVLRVESGRLSVRMACVDVSRLVRQCVREFKEAAATAGIELRLGLSEKIYCYADVNLFDRALQNLLDNALKFTPKGGRVCVSTRCLGDRILVSVADTGRGISKAALPHVFDRYYQGEGPGRQKGLGLGLTFCREALEALGGSISVESEEAKGSVFTLSLRLAKAGVKSSAAR